MGEDKGRLGWRTVVLWLLALLFVAFTFVDDDERQELADDAEVAATETDGSSRLKIKEIKPFEASPGAPVVVHVTGKDADDATPLTATVGKIQAEVLDRRRDHIVIRIPVDIQAGPAKVRAHQGERRSKPRDVRVSPVQRRKVVRNVMGGLARCSWG